MRLGAARHASHQILLAAALLLICGAALPACGSHSAAPPTTPAAHILFIGNSYTYYNGGIDAMLHGLAPSITTAAVTVGGYTLEKHWDSGQALAEINQGGWTFVVLQEQSQTPVLAPQTFDQYVRGFDQEIRRTGAKTVLLMTWQRPDSVAIGVTTSGLAAAYEQAGKDVGALVAPAGLAFATALDQRPRVALTSPDGHPTVEGTYLAACVLYGALFHRSPVGNPFGSIPSDEKIFLQHMAAEMLGL